MIRGLSPGSLSSKLPLPCAHQTHRLIDDRPPPDDSIFTEPVNIASAQVGIEPSTNRLYTVPSPVHPKKKYHQFNILYANSIDFGVTVAENAMSIMQTVDTYNKVRMTLSLGDRKELDFQFPRMIDNVDRNLRFRLPLSLVNVIYKVNDSETGQCALIIPFETPPQFFMQKKKDEMTQTFSPDERKWIDWNSWYRQTDVADGATKDRLKTVPATTHKDEAIIDIGESRQ